MYHCTGDETQVILPCLDVDERNPGPGVEVLEDDVASSGLTVADVHQHGRRRIIWKIADIKYRTLIYVIK